MMNKELYQITIAAILKYARTQREITLGNASQISGLSLQYIGELERGEKSPSESSIDILCDSYHICIDRSISSEKKGIENLNDFIRHLNFLSLTNIDIDYLLSDSDFSLSFLYDCLLNEAYYLIIKNDHSRFPFFLKIFSKFYERIDGLLFAFYNYLLSVYYDFCGDEKCLYYAKMSIDNSQIGEAFFRANYSALLFNYNHLIQALKENENSIFISQNNSYFKLIQLSRMNQGLIFIKLRQYSEAISTLNECLENASDNNIDDIVIKCRENIVYAYLLDNKLNQGIEYCDKWLKTNNYTFQLAHMIDFYYKNEVFTCDIKSINELYKAMCDIRKDIDNITIDKYTKKFELDYISYYLFINAVIYNLEKSGNYELESKHLKRLLNFTQF